jgi:hypothetical protein
MDPDFHQRQALIKSGAFKLGLALCVGLTLLYLNPPHFPALDATG